MVCEKCEKKGNLAKVATPEPWKAGSSARKINENKLLTSKNRFNPVTGDTNFPKCRICKSRVHQQKAHYCQDCAYKKGICALCGTKIISTKNYKQSST